MSSENVEMTRRGLELWTVAMGGGDEESRRSALGQMVENYGGRAELTRRHP